VSSPVRVAHIITKLELGGAQQVALFTVAQLNRAKYAPILIAGEPGLLDEEARAIAGLEFHRIPSLVRPIHPWSDMVALYQLTRLLIRLRPTIVQTHSSKAGLLGRWAARLAGVPIILHYVHGYGFTPAQPPWLRRLLIWGERRTGRITTKVFTASSTNLRQGVELGLFTDEQALGWIWTRSGDGVWMSRGHAGSSALSLPARWSAWWRPSSRKRRRWILSAWRRRSIGSDPTSDSCSSATASFARG
jgi:hypothetical protein